MCFNKKLKKQIADLQTTVDQLNQTIVTQELQRLRVESNDLKGIREDLSHIHLNLKNARILADDLGYYYLEVSYEVPTLKVLFDADGKPVRNNFFKAINNLNLLNQKDLEKLTDQISKIQEKIKK